MVCLRNIIINTLHKGDDDDDDDDDDNNNNNNNNKFPYYLCAGTTATWPIIRTAQGHKENTKRRATN